MIEIPNETGKLSITSRGDQVNVTLNGEIVVQGIDALALVLAVLNTATGSAKISRVKAVVNGMA